MPTQRSLSSIRYIAAAQRRDGGFLGASAAAADVSRAAPSTESTFNASLIASCLASLPRRGEAAAGMERILGRIARFLSSQRSAQGSWGYFSGASKAAQNGRYPDDLDDTSCALLALRAADPALAGGDALARLVEILFVCEDRTGGPYHTWIFSGVKRSRWKDVDLVVNANVGSFLAQSEVHLPNVARFIDKAVLVGDIETRYYDRLASAYFISRYYSLRPDKAGIDGQRKALARLVERLRKPDGSWGDPLSTALALSSLARIGASAEAMRKGAEYLERTRAKDGSWPAAPLYREEKKDGVMLYSGSRPLSTAFALEALALFDEAAAREGRAEESARVDAFCAEAARLVRAEIRSLPQPLRSQAERLLGAMESKRLDRLILPLPFAFGQAMKGAKRPSCERLAVANMLGWMGYTAQDDLMDGDSDARLLPLSNALLRRSLALLESEAPTEAGKALVRGAFDAMDRANAAEIATASPEYGDGAIIAEKSLGHALGPLILAMKAGLSPGGARFKALREFFMQYLIARQMNDDAHDWEKDLDQGRENYVCAGLMRANRRAKPGARKPSRSALKAFFWERHIDEVSKEVFWRAAAARKAFAEARIADPSFADALLAPIEKAALKAVTERDRAREFMKAR